MMMMMMMGWFHLSLPASLLFVSGVTEVVGLICGHCDKKVVVVFFFFFLTTPRYLDVTREGRVLTIQSRHVQNGRY